MKAWKCNKNQVSKDFKRSRAAVKVASSDNMKPVMYLWKLVLLASVATSIDFVSADEEGTTEAAPDTVAPTIEPG